MSTFHHSISTSGRVTLVKMTRCLLIVVVSTPLTVAGWLVMLLSGFFATIWCFWCGAPLLATTAAYVFDRSTIVKLSWVISDAWEAFWYDMRRGLSPVGANCGALVVVSVVCAVPFSAEVGVLKSMDMGDVDTLLGFEFMEVMRGKRGVVDEVG
jgi:hypothetical protein